MSNMATNHTQYIKQEIKKVLKSLISNTSSWDWVGLFTFNIRPQIKHPYTIHHWVGWWGFFLLKVSHQLDFDGTRKYDHEIYNTYACNMFLFREYLLLTGSEVITCT